MDLGTKIPVLDDGYIQLVDVMGTDKCIEDAARVSYGEGTRATSATEGLLRYLMRHRHTTPFEMVEMKFKVRVPMDCWRQWIRHRTANVNEYSTRYSIAIDSQQETGIAEWRVQSKTNKQGSEEGKIDWPESGNPGFEDTPETWLTERERRLHSLAREVYDERIAMGVAREQARKDLPLSTYTEAFWKCDLHNIFHFLSLRMDSHAQKEIRDYAFAMAGMVESRFPIAYKAFSDYRLNGMFLTGIELEALAHGNADQIANKREREECIVKINNLRGKLGV